MKQKPIDIWVERKYNPSAKNTNPFVNQYVWYIIAKILV